MQSHSNADDQAAGVAIHDRLILSSTTIQGVEAPEYQTPSVYHHPYRATRIEIKVGWPSP